MKRSKVPTLLAIILPIAAAAVWLVSTSRAAIETPDYKVLRTDEKFEIRDYPTLTIAPTLMKDDGMNGGFGQLFRFITGKNEGSEKIEMTAPVLIAGLRVAGGRTAEIEKAAIEKLTTWLDGQKIAGKGDPIFAYYDPPWTPVFLDRNEVMIRIDKHHD